MNGHALFIETPRAGGAVEFAFQPHEPDEVRFAENDREIGIRIETCESVPELIKNQGELQIDQCGVFTKAVSLRSAGPQRRSGRIASRFLTQGEMPHPRQWAREG